MSQVPALSVKGLTKTFKGKKPFTAVNNISFAIKQGEILGLLGPNGAGKTTTIQMLLSTLKPTAGTIKYFGKDLATHRSEVLKNVSFASTYIRLPWRLKVRENLDVYGRLYGLTSAERKFRIEKFLKFFDSWDLREREVSTLSAGQTTRVMLVKAFLAHPRIALLDEPTASLDPDIAHEVRAFVLEQQREYEVSMLFTSHNMQEVTEVCDRVLFLQNGKIIRDDTPERIAASVSTSHVQLMVGDGLKRTIKFAEEQKLTYKIEERWITIEIDETKIAFLLSGLAKSGVEYTEIMVDKPTLEDYFLQLSKKAAVTGKKSKKERT